MANAYINIQETLSPSDLLYIATNKQLQADIVNAPNNAIFTGAAILYPSPLLPTTTTNDFVFYINRQQIPSSFVSFDSYIGGVSITFNTSSLGFSLNSTDTVTAIGKFA
jgi:hypothetical protein